MADIEEARKIIDKADKELARIFCERFSAVKAVAEYKHKNGLPVFDAKREDEVIKRAAGYVGEELRPYFEELLKKNIELSKEYQKNLISGGEKR